MRNAIVITIIAAFMLPMSRGMAEQNSASSQPAATPICAHYQLVVRLHSSIYPTRTFYGVVSFDKGPSCRFVLYWKEPVDGYYDISSDYAFIDILLDGKKIEGRLGSTLESDGHFAIDLSKPMPTFDLRSTNSTAFITSIVGRAANLRLDKAPHDQKVAMLLPSALASQLGYAGVHTWTTSAPSDSGKEEQVPNPHQILTPFGRRGQIRAEKDGGINMHIVGFQTGEPVLDVQLRPVVIAFATHEGIFDASTLGNPPHVPGIYKEFWGLWRSFWMLRGISSDDRLRKAAVIQKSGIECLQRGVPDRMVPAFYALVARSSATAGDVKTALGAVKAMLTCQSIDTASAIMFLAEMRTLLGSAGEAISEIDRIVAARIRAAIEEGVPLISLAELVEPLISIKGYATAKLIVSELRRFPSINPKILDDYEKQIGSWQISSDTSVKEPEYVTAFRAKRQQQLPRGPITQEFLKAKIRESLMKAGAASELADAFASNTVDKIVVLAGTGPYRGAPELLAGAISRAATLHQRGKNSTDWLAMMITLSFYDESTPELRRELQDQLLTYTDKMVDYLWNEAADAVTGKNISKEDVREHALASMRSLVQSYLDDALWPTFKYPLSDNELTRIQSRIELQVRREVKDLLPIMIKADASTLRNMLYERASLTAGSILARTLSVRLPTVAGIGFERQGEGVLLITWKVTIPQDRHKAEDLLDKCMYFYLGHRLKQTAVSSLASSQPAAN